MVHYTLILITLDIKYLAKVLIKTIFKYYVLSNFIITKWELLFTLKF